MRSGPIDLVEHMIYAGYEHEHYFIRASREIRMAYLASVLHDGYKLVWQHMLLIKRRRIPVGYRRSDSQESVRH